MIENEQTNTESKLDLTKPDVFVEREQATDTATLLNRIDQLEKDLAKSQGLAEAFKSAVDYHVNTINEVKQIVESEIEGGGWDTDDQFCQDLCEALDIALTEETEVEIVVRWNTTVTHPKGMNLADISVDVSDPSLDGDGCSFTWLDLVDTEVNEA